MSMFLTRKHLSRRTVLRGLGAAVSLPLLDAMIPARTLLAQTAAAPSPRLGFVYFPHGAVMDKWTPTQDGTDFVLPQILKPLDPFRKQLTIVSGLENKPCAGAPPVHALNPGTWLSCALPKPGADPHGAITIDQLAAQALGQDTPLPSLEVGTEATGGAGFCDRTYGCSYAGTISFRSPTTPLPMETNPRKLFERLFGQGDDAADRKKVSGQYKSILDMVLGEAQTLQQRLGVQDRAVLGDYLETVREIERRIQKTEERDLSRLELPTVPVGVPDSVDEYLNLMFEMVALAYQANLTRVFTFMMAAEVSNRTYTHIGISDAFHPLSHHANDPAKIERLARIQAYHSQVFAKFVTRLAAMPDGDGSVLDHSLLMYGSNMSNSNLHDEFPLPAAIVGGGWGRMKGGQHLRYKDRTPLANLHLTLLQRAGVAVETVGDSTGAFAEA